MLEQRLNTDFLRPCLIERACAGAIVAVGIGAAVLLGASGLSRFWNFKTPELSVRIANPEVHLNPNAKVTVEQDRPFALAPPSSEKLDTSAPLGKGMQTIPQAKGTDAT